MIFNDVLCAVLYCASMIVVQSPMTLDPVAQYSRSQSHYYMLEPRFIRFMQRIHVMRSICRFPPERHEGLGASVQ